MERGANASLAEEVLLVGQDLSMQGRLEKAGFAVSDAAEEDITRMYELRGVPWLIFVRPDGAIAYAGGYAADREGKTGYRDLAIWRGLQARMQVESLPAYGCAVGERLQRRIDPLGLRYLKAMVRNNE